MIHLLHDLYIWQRVSKTVFSSPNSVIYSNKCNSCKIDLHWDYIMIFIFQDSLIRTTCRSWGFSHQSVRYIEARHTIDDLNLNTVSKYLMYYPYPYWHMLNAKVPQCKVWFQSMLTAFQLFKGTSHLPAKTFLLEQVTEGLQMLCDWMGTARVSLAFNFSASTWARVKLFFRTCILSKYLVGKVPLINKGWRPFLMIVFQCTGWGDSAHSQGVTNKQHEAGEYFRHCLCND